MSLLTDAAIRGWIARGEYFSKRRDSENLYLEFRESFKFPVWKFRYKLDGRERKMSLGSFRDVGVAQARKVARELRARIALGEDPAESRKVKAEDRKRKEQEDAWTVGALAMEWWERFIDGKCKHPGPPLALIRNHIIGNPIGSISLHKVRASDVDALLRFIALERKAPTASTKVLRCLQKVFDFGVRTERMPMNPAALFTRADAGGQEKPKERFLTEREIHSLYQAMKTCGNVAIENILNIRLLLMLGVRTIEIREAAKAEFDLDAGLWHLPAERSKNGQGITIPLPPKAVDHIRMLFDLSGGSKYLMPVRYGYAGSSNTFATPGALRLALNRMRGHMDCAPFSPHDLRRTTRTLLAKLGVPHHVGELCLNHRVGGVSAVYNRHEYLEERREALLKLSAYLDDIEAGLTR
jgi:integrase